MHLHSLFDSGDYRYTYNIPYLIQEFIDIHLRHCLFNSGYYRYTYNITYLIQDIIDTLTTLLI